MIDASPGAATSTGVRVLRARAPGLSHSGLGARARISSASGEPRRSATTTSLRSMCPSSRRRSTKHTSAKAGTSARHTVATTSAGSSDATSATPSCARVRCSRSAMRSAERLSNTTTAPERRSCSWSGTAVYRTGMASPARFTRKDSSSRSSAPSRRVTRASRRSGGGRLPSARRSGAISSRSRPRASRSGQPRSCSAAGFIIVILASPSTATTASLRLRVTARARSASVRARISFSRACTAAASATVRRRSLSRPRAAEKCRSSAAASCVTMVSANERSSSSSGIADSSCSAPNGARRSTASGSTTNRLTGLVEDAAPALFGSRPAMTSMPRDASPGS